MDVQRVVLDGLTPSEYRTFVASSLNERRFRQNAALPITSSSTVPGWVSVFQDLVENLRNSRTCYRPRLGIANNLAYPVMHYAWRKVGGWEVGGGRLLLSGEARRSLRQSLLKRLSFTAKNPAEWMWNVLRANSALLIESRGEASEVLLRNAVFANGVEPLALRLLEDYPALARLWAVQVINWRCCISQFLERAITFAREYLGLRTTRIVRKIETDLSDPHSENRSVMQVWFEDGSRWFYKPRSGDSEKAWFTLLGWLNEQNFSTQFALVKIISERDYCWMRAVQHRQCRSKKEATRYYFRAGALLFLVHWLRGVDFHAGNIIAHGTQPIIVDSPRES